MRTLLTRLDHLERESAQRLGSTQCATCRDWTFVCWVTVATDGTETWGSAPPEACPRCGWVADLVMFHVIDDWRNVTLPGRGR